MPAGRADQLSRLGIFGVCKGFVNGLRQPRKQGVSKDSCMQQDLWQKLWEMAVDDFIAKLLGCEKH